MKYLVLHTEEQRVCTSAGSGAYSSSYKTIEYTSFAAFEEENDAIAWAKKHDGHIVMTRDLLLEPETHVKAKT